MKSADKYVCALLYEVCTQMQGCTQCLKLHYEFRSMIHFATAARSLAEVDNNGLRFLCFMGKSFPKNGKLINFF